MADNLNIPQPHENEPGLKGMSEDEKKKFLEDVHEAVYGCILGAFIQGLEVISKASKMQVSTFILRTHTIVKAYGARNGTSRYTTVS